MGEPSDADVTAWHAHVDQLQARHGVELDNDDRRELWESMDGFNTAATEAAFAEQFGGGDFDDDEPGPEWQPDDGEAARNLGAELADRDSGLAVREAGKKLGRKLTNVEVERVAEMLPAQTAFGDRIRPEHVTAAFEAAGVKSWSEMSRDEQARTMAASVHEAEGRDPKTGLELRDEYDLDDPQQRDEYDVLRVSGHEFDDTGESE